MNDPAFPETLFADKELPQFVFSRAQGTFMFFEFALAFSEVAWQLFARLAREFREAAVLCRCIAPDAEKYFRRHFGESAQFSFEATNAPQAYVSQMHSWPSDSIADAVAYRGDVVAWAGSSGRWACWGERASGICVLRVEATDSFRGELISDNYPPLLTLTEALEDVASSEMTTQELAYFSEQMLRYYPR